MAERGSNRVSRRRFLKTAAGAAAVAGFPTIVPSSVFGQLAPSKQINVGAIGVGRVLLEEGGGLFCSDASTGQRDGF